MTKRKHRVRLKIEKIFRDDGYYLASRCNLENFSGSIKNSLYFTIKNNSKNFREIIDFEFNKIKTRISLQNVSDEIKNKYRSLIQIIIDKIKSESIILKDFRPVSFCRYQKKFLYIDHVLLINKTKAILLTAVHLAQFAILKNFNGINVLINFHRKLNTNISKINELTLEKMKFSLLYGKSTKIGSLCICIGLLICIISVLKVISIWNIIFGLLAIATGIWWLFPID